jgi:ribose/xylose/arabinose/galactoside ABC-type transport system permease subunit
LSLSIFYRQIGVKTLDDDTRSAATDAGSHPDDNYAGKSLTAKPLRNNISILALLFLLVLLVGGVATPSMYSARNFINVQRSAAIVGVIGLGMSVAILVGEIDISMGSIMSLAGMMGGLCISNIGSLSAILVTCAIGGALGAVNGILITKMRISALMSTLGTMLIYQGFSEMTTAGQPIMLFTAVPYRWIGQQLLFGVPVGFVFFLVIAALLAFVLGRTRLGKDAYFTGANSRTAWLSGVNVDRIKIMAMTFSGVCAAFAGVLLAGQTNQVGAKMGHGYELSGIAIAVIGGTALGGGKGSVIGTALGTFIYQVLLNVLSLSGQGTYAEQVLKGSLLVLIVVVYQVINDKKKL